MSKPIFNLINWELVPITRSMSMVSNPKDAKIYILEGDSNDRFGKPGRISTSKLISIDFKERTAETKNSIYHLD